MKKREIITSNSAPSAIGPYNQAVKVGKTVYLSGQIPLNAEMELVNESIQKESTQVFQNMREVCRSAGGDLNQIVKITIFLTDMDLFAEVNEVMKTFFAAPYPARSTVTVKELPKKARIEVEGIMVL